MQTTAILSPELAERVLRLPFAARVQLVNDYVGHPLMSHQLAPLWLSLLEWADRTEIEREEKLTIARELLQLAPESNTASVAISRLLAGPEVGPIRLVQIIVSCRKRLREATDLHASIDGILGPAFIVVGDSNLRCATRSEGLVTVPAADNYESLTTKVCEALVAIRQTFSAAAVLKLDDDLFRYQESDVKGFFRTVEGADYVGQPCGHPQFDRTWHFGKCETPSPPIYRKPYRTRWARGPLYFLGPRTVDFLVHQYLRYPGEFAETWGFEDKCVGDMLSSNGFSLKPEPLWRQTGLKERGNLIGKH